VPVMVASGMSALIAAVLLAVGGIGSGSTTAVAGAPAKPPPNIVFVLTDDLSWDLVSHMPHVQALARKGASLQNYYVTDSLCCPSRATIFTGEYPHNTKVISNIPPRGGYASFNQNHDEQNTWARSLHGAGYDTAMMGKYLNGYAPDNPIPPGWSDWEVASSKGYAGYGYRFNRNGTVTPPYGYAPKDYLTTVLKGRAKKFIDSAATPFALEVATYSPHDDVKILHTNPNVKPGYATPAPRDDKPFQCLHNAFRVPRGGSFNVKSVHAPKWLDTRRLSPHEREKLDARFCKRAQAVESVDRMVGTLERELVKQGIAKNTYFVFSSDNGFHTGQHRLGAGKMTAFEEDIRVPFIVTGPGIQPGTKINEIGSNIDLAPTFDAMAGASVMPTVDGHNLLGLLHGTPGAGAGWRKRVMVEHRFAPKNVAGPDRQSRRDGYPPSYKAIRGRNYLYVEYSHGPLGQNNRPEYYRLHGDAYTHERVNTYRKLSKRRRHVLHLQVKSLLKCHGHAGRSSCWTRAGGT
jgi:arylsulfatase A-like enzyme